MNEDFKKKMGNVSKGLGEAVQEGMEKIRTLGLSSSLEISEVLNMSDEQILDLLEEQGFDLEEHYVRIETPKGTSEQYMKSPGQIRDFLKRFYSN